MVRALRRPLGDAGDVTMSIIYGRFGSELWLVADAEAFMVLGYYHVVGTAMFRLSWLEELLCLQCINER